MAELNISCFANIGFACTKGFRRDPTVIKSTDVSATRRMVAACCNSAMDMAFDDKRHWVSAYRNRFEGDFPPLEVRICTRSRTSTQRAPRQQRTQLSRIPAQTDLPAEHARHDPRAEAEKKPHLRTSPCSFSSPSSRYWITIEPKRFMLIIWMRGCRRRGDGTKRLALDRDPGSLVLPFISCAGRMTLH